MYLPMVTMKKEVKEVTMLDKIKEKGLEDQLPPEQPFDEEEDPVIVKQPKILAIVNSTRKSKLMLYECKERGIELSNIITEEKFHEQPMKFIPKIVDEELKKDKYQVLYLPISNTDFNKNPNQWNELRGVLQHKKEINVNYYFDGHDDIEISNRVFAAGID